MNAYVLSFAVLLLTGSALGDRFGRRRMFVAGLGLFTSASAACALAPGMGALIAARAVEGAGAALIMPLALTQLSAAFPADRRGRALGIFSGLTGLATFSGPFIGGAVAQGLAWRWIFWINIPIAAIAILLVLRRMGESHGPNFRFDIWGVVLATGGALGLVCALVRGNSAGWGSREVIAAAAAGACLVAAFVAWELRTSTPMLPMRFFRCSDPYVTAFWLGHSWRITSRITMQQVTATGPISVRAQRQPSARIRAIIPSGSPMRSASALYRGALRTDLTEPGIASICGRCSKREAAGAGSTRQRAEGTGQLAPYMSAEGTAQLARPICRCRARQWRRRAGWPGR